MTRKYYKVTLDDTEHEVILVVDKLTYDIYKEFYEKLENSGAQTNPSTELDFANLIKKYREIGIIYIRDLRPFANKSAYKFLAQKFCNLILRNLQPIHSAKLALQKSGSSLSLNTVGYSESETAEEDTGFDFRDMASTEPTLREFKSINFPNTRRI